MSLRLLTVPCQIQHFKQEPSPLGSSVRVADGAPIDAVCRIDARGASPQEAGANAEEVTRWVIFLGPSTDPNADDEVTIASTVYSLIGKPWAAANARGAIHHYECPATER